MEKNMTWPESIILNINDTQFRSKYAITGQIEAYELSESRFKWFWHTECDDSLHFTTDFTCTLRKDANAAFFNHFTWIVKF